MIDFRLRKKIETNLKLSLDKNDWKYIDEMFSEVYLDTIGGKNKIALKPHPHAGELSIEFSPITGSYVDTAETVNTHIDIKSTKTGVSYPEYPSVTCFVYYYKDNVVTNKEADKIPVRNLNVQFHVYTKATLYSTGQPEVIQCRECSTDYKGYVTFHLFPIHKYDSSNYVSWSKRTMEPKFNRDGTISNPIVNVLDASEYNIYPDGSKVNCKIVFPEGQKEHDFDKNLDRLFDPITIDTSFTWNKCENNIVLSRAIGSRNGTTLTLDEGLEEKLLFHYYRTSDNVSYQGSSGDPTVSLDYSITNTGSSSVTANFPNGTSREVTKGNTITGSVLTGSSVGLEHGFTWIKFTGGDNGDSVNVTLSSLDNAFYKKCSKTWTVSWKAKGNYYFKDLKVTTNKKDSNGNNLPDSV